MGGMVAVPQAEKETLVVQLNQRAKDEHYSWFTPPTYPQSTQTFIEPLLNLKQTFVK